MGEQQPPLNPTSCPPSSTTSAPYLITLTDPLTHLAQLLMLEPCQPAACIALRIIPVHLAQRAVSLREGGRDGGTARG
jgi:hypothetical protein